MMNLEKFEFLKSKSLGSRRFLEVRSLEECLRCAEIEMGRCFGGGEGYCSAMSQFGNSAHFRGGA